MTRFSKILFPVDFSDRSRAAAPYVLDMALRHHTDVVLLHAIHPPPPMYGGMNTVYPEVFDFTEFRTVMLRELEKFGAAELPKVAVTCAVDVGDTASIIEDYAGHNAIDLIAMPTHGYGIFRRALLGSVTAKILSDAKVPVWTSAHAPDPSHRAHPMPRRIVVGLDLKPSSKATLLTAVALARETGATVIAAHALAEGVVVPGMADPQLQELLLESAKAELAAIQLRAGTEVESVIEVKVPAALIRDVALDKRADLVVIGRERDHGVLSRFRVNANAIIREAPCPVLSL